MSIKEFLYSSNLSQQEIGTFERMFDANVSQDPFKYKACL